MVCCCYDSYFLDLSFSFSFIGNENNPKGVDETVYCHYVLTISGLRNGTLVPLRSFYETVTIPGASETFRNIMVSHFDWNTHIYNYGYSNSFTCTFYKGRTHLIGFYWAALHGSLLSFDVAMELFHLNQSFSSAELEPYFIVLGQFGSVSDDFILDVLQRSHCDGILS